MSFFQRLASYWLNEVLVQGLANSPTFQRFAIRSNEKMGKAQAAAKEYAAKANDPKMQQEMMTRASTFSKTFKEEMEKGLKEINKKVP